MSFRRNLCILRLRWASKIHFSIKVHESHLVLWPFSRLLRYERFVINLSHICHCFRLFWNLNCAQICFRLEFYRFFLNFQWFFLNFIFGRFRERRWSWRVNFNVLDCVWALLRDIFGNPGIADWFWSHICQWLKFVLRFRWISDGKCIWTLILYQWSNSGCGVRCPFGFDKPCDKALWFVHILCTFDMLNVALGLNMNTSGDLFHP